MSFAMSFSVLLAIFHIILYILLILLILVLLVLLLVLFVPVRYSFAGRFGKNEQVPALLPEHILKGEDGNECCFSFRFSWLFRAVSGCFHYPEERSLKIRLLFCKMAFPGEKNKKKEKKKKDSDAQNEKYDKMDSRKNRDKILMILKDPQTPSAVRMALTELTGVIKRLLPQHLKLTASLGFGEPDTTGEVMAIVSMLYPVIGPSADLSWDFEGYRFYADISGDGKIRGITIICAAVRVLLNRSMQHLVGQIRE